MNDADRLRLAAPEDLARAFDGLVPSSLAERLAATARFGERLVEAAFGPAPPESSAAPGARGLALNAAGLADLVRRAGAVWRAHAIVLIIDGAALRDLRATIGEDAYADALAGRRLAPGLHADEPAYHLGPGALDPIEGDFVSAITSDGRACWAAWCRVQPEPVARRLALLGSGARPGDPHAVFGPQIIDWLLDRT